jgi:hypothetical protein
MAGKEGSVVDESTIGGRGDKLLRKIQALPRYGWRGAKVLAPIKACGYTDEKKFLSTLQTPDYSRFSRRHVMAKADRIDAPMIAWAACGFRDPI